MNWTHTFGTHCIYVLKKSGSVYNDIPPHVFVPPKHIVTTKLAAHQQTPWKLKTVKSHHVTTHAYFYVPAKSPCANTPFELYAIMTLYIKQLLHQMYSCEKSVNIYILVRRRTDSSKARHHSISY